LTLSVSRFSYIAHRSMRHILCGCLSNSSFLDANQFTPRLLHRGSPMNIVHRALRKAEAIVFLVDLASLGLALLTARLHRKATRQAQPDATGGVVAFDRSRCALQGYRFHTRDAISLAFFQTIIHARHQNGTPAPRSLLPVR